MQKHDCNPPFCHIYSLKSNTHKNNTKGTQIYEQCHRQLYYIFNFEFESTGQIALCCCVVFCGSAFYNFEDSPVKLLILVGLIFYC